MLSFHTLEQIGEHVRTVVMITFSDLLALKSQKKNDLPKTEVTVSILASLTLPEWSVAWHPKKEETTDHRLHTTDTAEKIAVSPDSENNIWGLAAHA